MKSVIRTTCFAFFLLFINFFEGVYEKFGSAYASQTNILEVIVQGAKRIDPETIISFGQFELGEQLDDVKLNEIIKNLFNTGLFADVQLSLQDGLLTVVVEENPLINRVILKATTVLMLKTWKKNYNLNQDEFLQGQRYNKIPKD